MRGCVFSWSNTLPVLTLFSYPYRFLMKFLFAKALFLLTSKWITESSHIASLSITNWFGCHSFPLHHLLKCCFVRQCSTSSGIVFLSEINGSIVITWTILSFSSTCTAYNLFTFTFVIFVLEKTMGVPMSLCLNPWILCDAKPLYQLRISIQIAPRLLFSNTRSTISLPFFSYPILKIMPLCIPYLFMMRQMSPCSFKTFISINVAKCLPIT